MSRARPRRPGRRWQRSPPPSSPVAKRSQLDTLLRIRRIDAVYRKRCRTRDNEFSERAIPAADIQPFAPCRDRQPFQELACYEAAPAADISFIKIPIRPIIFYLLQIRIVIHTLLLKEITRRHLIMNFKVDSTLKRL